MCCDNKCGCNRRSKCNICGIFNGFSRRSCGCGCGGFDNDFRAERFERCERFEKFDNCGNFRNFRDFDRIGHGRNHHELTRADFDGFFPEARFEKKVTKECCCCKR